ncbi:TatD DNase family Scn1 [Polyporus arcularius HHB13444]|uniref:TatD DNase family Scn1 n=1 Tax=Polyporus arcularius HHB13444 TaxID=1314778 RepID=A0A5C3PZH1_9APHY|nr:TatD DNase family Scn1 [Polyporus arcularius HHB13444]
MRTALDSVPRSVLEHVVDVHCHPTDSGMEMTLKVAQEMAIRICAMATRRSDQRLVAALARAHPDKVIPCFGYHPWFAHWIAVETITSKDAHYRTLFLPPSSPPKPEHVSAFDRLLPFLPDPIPLAEVVADLNENLTAFPNAMLGEVGLDRVCRIPYSHPDGPRELSPFTIPLAHQLKVVEAQLDVAVRLRRNVSLHSVKCQQATSELLDRMEAKYPDEWLKISVDLHSCGLSAQGWKAISKRHPNAFLSLSTAINARSPAHKELIAACASDRILVESDFHDIRRSAPYTWHMLRTVAAVKGWAIEDHWDDAAPEDEAQWGAVRRLEENWKAFERGRHRPHAKRRQRRDRAIEEWEDANEDSD